MSKPLVLVVALALITVACSATNEDKRSEDKASATSPIAIPAEGPALTGCDGYMVTCLGDSTVYTVPRDALPAGCIIGGVDPGPPSSGETVASGCICAMQGDTRTCCSTISGPTDTHIDPGAGGTIDFTALDCDDPANNGLMTGMPACQIE